MNKSYFIDFNPNYWSNRTIISEDISKTNSEASVTELIAIVAEKNFKSLRLRGFSSRPKKWSSDEARRADLKTAVGSKIMSLFPLMIAGGLSGYLRYQMTNSAAGNQFNSGTISKLETILTNPNISYMVNSIITDILATGAISKNDAIEFKNIIDDKNNRINIVKQWEERINTDTDTLDDTTCKILIKSIGSALKPFKQRFKEEKGNKESIIDIINDWKESYLNDANSRIYSLLDVIVGNTDNVINFLLERELDELIRKKLITERTKTEFLEADADTQFKTLKYWAKIPKIYNKYYNRETAKEFLEADEGKTKEILKKWSCVVNPDNAHSLFTYTWLENPKLVEDIVENALKQNTEKAIDIRKGIGDVSERDYFNATKNTVEGDLRRGVYDTTDMSDEDKQFGKEIFNALHNVNRMDNPEELEKAALHMQQSQERLAAMLQRDDEADIDWYADDEDEEALTDIESSEDMTFDEDEEDYYLPGMEECIYELIPMENDDYQITLDVINRFDLTPTQEVIDFIMNMVRTCRGENKNDYSDSFDNYDEENYGYDDEDDTIYVSQYSDYDNRGDVRSLEGLVDRFYTIHGNKPFKESYKYIAESYGKYQKAMDLAKWILTNRCDDSWETCMRNIDKLDSKFGQEARTYGYQSIASLMQAYYDYKFNSNKFTSTEVKTHKAGDSTHVHNNTIAGIAHNIPGAGDWKLNKNADIKVIDTTSNASQKDRALALAKEIYNDKCLSKYNIFNNRIDGLEQIYGNKARKLGYTNVEDLITRYLNNDLHEAGTNNKQIKKYVSDDWIARNPRKARELGVADEWGNKIKDYYYADVSYSDISQFGKYKNNHTPTQTNRSINFETLNSGTYYTQNYREIAGILNLLSQRDPGNENAKYGFEFIEPIYADSDETHRVYSIQGDKRNYTFKCRRAYNKNNAGQYTFYQLKNSVRDDEQIDGTIERMFMKAVDHDAYHFDISPSDIECIDIVDGEITIYAKYPKAVRR